MLDQIYCEAAHNRDETFAGLFRKLKTLALAEHLHVSILADIDRAIECGEQFTYFLGDFVIRGRRRGEVLQVYLGNTVEIFKNLAESNKFAEFMQGKCGDTATDYNAVVEAMRIIFGDHAILELALRVPIRGKHDSTR